MLAAFRPVAIVLAVALAAACGGSSTAPATPRQPTADPPAEAPVLIGTLLGHDGNPMPMAHVAVDGEPTLVGDDGGFRIPLPAAGFAKVQFTGVDHGDHAIGLLLDGRPVRVDVRLGTYEAAPSFDAATVVELRFGDDGAIALGRTVPMQRADDGTLEAQLEADGEVAYEIRGIVRDSGRSMNGSARTEFRYDGDGNYANVASPAGGAVRIVHDPKAVTPPGIATAVSFDDPDGPTARVSRLFESIERARRASDPPAAPLVSADAIAAERDPRVRAAMLVAFFASNPTPPDHAGEAEVALAKRGLDELPADSPLWKMAPTAALAMVTAAGDDRGDYLERVVDGLGDGVAAAELLFGMMWAARTEGREDNVGVYYEIMMSRFADTPLARPSAMFDPNKQIRPGNKVPAFDLASFDDGTRRLTPASFEGKTVLIEFWATWCKPCVGEMGNLHAAFERYGPKGFTILSINVDDSADHVREFRAGKWKMPWAHVVLEGDSAKPVKQMFEVPALPSQLLVGPDGTILAVDPTLRGDGLAEQLGRALSD